MKLLGFLLFLTVLKMATVFATTAKNKNQTQVEVQWASDVDADKYDIELKTKTGQAIKKFQSKNSLFKLSVSPGRYLLRVQVETLTGRFGPWSDWIDVNVPPKKVEFDDDIKSQFAAQPGELKTALKLKWKAQPTAEKYEIVVKTQQNEVVQILESDKPEIQTQLLPGKYFFTVATIAEDGLKSKPSAFKYPIEIASAQLPVMEMQPLAAHGATVTSLECHLKEGISYFYKLEKSFLLSDRWTEIGVKPLQNSIWSPAKDLEAGKYRVSFWGEAPAWKKSEPVSWEFVVKPRESDLASH